MKEASRVRASHVNVGTSVQWPIARRARGPEFRHPKLTAATESSDSTPLGGLALAARAVAKLGIAGEIDGRLSLLRSHRPYRGSDHVLTHVYNLFVTVA